MAERRILFLVYDGFEILDMAGPASVFSAANTLSGRALYDVEAVSMAARASSSGGMAMLTTPLSSVQLSGQDTVLVAGAGEEPLQRAADEKAHHSFLQAAATSVERYGSVCSGAFILAAAGLLAGRRATTHWIACEAFRSLFAEVTLEPDALYVNDGRLWTSAGVTTGIDMALAMLALDHGAALMGQVAKYLVVYAHRPGHQSQFSGVIDAQTGHQGAFADLITWLGERLDQPLTMAEISRQAGMSERTLWRRFTAATGKTPAQCLEDLRLDRARLALEAGDPVKVVAGRVGFRSEAAFRTFFTRRIGVTPSHYATMNAT